MARRRTGNMDQQRYLANATTALVTLIDRGETLMGKPQKPGENPARPGEYEERGPRGGQVRNPRTVTIEPGDKPLPPTQEPGRTWERTGPPKPNKK